MRLRLTLLLSIIVGATAAAAAADPTGADLPEVAEPNQILDPAGGQVVVSYLLEPEGFVEALEAEDEAGVIADAWNLTTEDRSGADVIVFFAPDWPAAGDLVSAIDFPELGTEVASFDPNETAIHFAPLEASDGVIWLMLAVEGASPFDVPGGCYARLLLTVVHRGGPPEDFALEACSEAMGNG